MAKGLSAILLSSNTCNCGFISTSRRTKGMTRLSKEGLKDRAKLQLEAYNIIIRYIRRLAVGGIRRDDTRMRSGTWSFSVASKHASTEELAWSLRQFMPQLMMILTRARAAQALLTDDYTQAIQFGEQGIKALRNFFVNMGIPKWRIERRNSLRAWLEEIRSRRPLSPREKLERALNDAVKCEDYEKAAQVRDALRA